MLGCLVVSETASLGLEATIAGIGGACLACEQLRGRDVLVECGRDGRGSVAFVAHDEQQVDDEYWPIDDQKSLSGAAFSLSIVACMQLVGPRPRQRSCRVNQPPDHAAVATHAAHEYLHRRYCARG